MGVAVGENKHEVFTLIQRAVKKHLTDDGVAVYFCLYDKRIEIKRGGTLDIPDLECTYQEADYMFIAYAFREVGNVMVRS